MASILPQQAHSQNTMHTTQMATITEPTTTGPRQISASEPSSTDGTVNVYGPQLNASSNSTSNQLQLHQPHNQLQIGLDQLFNNIVQNSPTQPYPQIQQATHNQYSAQPSMTPHSRAPGPAQTGFQAVNSGLGSSDASDTKFIETLFWDSLVNDKQGLFYHAVMDFSPKEDDTKYGIWHKDSVPRQRYTTDCSKTEYLTPVPLTKYFPKILLCRTTKMECPDHYIALNPGQEVVKSEGLDIDIQVLSRICPKGWDRSDGKNPSKLWEYSIILKTEYHGTIYEKLVHIGVDTVEGQPSPLWGDVNIAMKNEMSAWMARVIDGNQLRAPPKMAVYQFQGPNSQRPNFQSPVMQGPVVQGPNTSARVVRGSFAQGPQMQSSNAHRPGVCGPNFQISHIQGPNIDRFQVATTQRPITQGTITRAPNPQIPMAYGPNSQGTITRQPYPQMPMAYGPRIQKSNAPTPNSQGPSLHGPDIQGPNFRSPAMQGPTIRGPATQVRIAQMPIAQRTDIQTHTIQRRIVGQASQSNTPAPPPSQQHDAGLLPAVIHRQPSSTPSSAMPHLQTMPNSSITPQPFGPTTSGFGILVTAGDSRTQNQITRRAVAISNEERRMPAQRPTSTTSNRTGLHASTNQGIKRTIDQVGDSNVPGATTALEGNHRAKRLAPSPRGLVPSIGSTPSPPTPLSPMSSTPTPPVLNPSIRDATRNATLGSPIKSPVLQFNGINVLDLTRESAMRLQEKIEKQARMPELGDEQLALWNRAADSIAQLLSEQNFSQESFRSFLSFTRTSQSHDRQQLSIQRRITPPSQLAGAMYLRPQNQIHRLQDSNYPQAGQQIPGQPAVATIGTSQLSNHEQNRRESVHAVNQMPRASGTLHQHQVEQRHLGSPTYNPAYNPQQIFPTMSHIESATVTPVSFRVNENGGPQLQQRMFGHIQNENIRQHGPMHSFMANPMHNQYRHPMHPLPGNIPQQAPHAGYQSLPLQQSNGEAQRYGRMTSQQMPRHQIPVQGPAQSATFYQPGPSMDDVFGCSINRTSEPHQNEQAGPLRFPNHHPTLTSSFGTPVCTSTSVSPPSHAHGDSRRSANANHQLVSGNPSVVDQHMPYDPKADPRYQASQAKLVDDLKLKTWAGTANEFATKA